MTGSLADSLPYAEQWTVVRPERNAQRDVIGYTEHVLRWCVYAPGSSQEDVQRGDQVLNSDTLYVLDSEADVVATDRVRGPRDASPTAGSMDMGVLAPWMVDGDPQARTSPFTGWMPGIVLRLKRVRGG